MQQWIRLVSRRAQRLANPPSAVVPQDGGRGMAPSAEPGGAWSGGLAAGDARLVQLADVSWEAPESRGAHCHSWFATLSRSYAENRCLPHALAASGALGEWLARDGGEGPAWAHSSDAGRRLVNWALGIGWLGEELDPDLRRRVAGSALFHARYLERELCLSPGEEDHRLIGQAAGLVVAGLSWPDLPGAGSWWSRGLSLLARYLPKQLRGDGAPLHRSPAELLDLLQVVLVARAFCRVNGVVFPEAADGALVRGACYLRAVAGDLSLPPLGGAPVETLLEPWGGLAGESPWNTVSALGLVTEAGGFRAEEDHNAWLLAGRPARSGERLAPPKNWRVAAFREGGLAVAHGLIRGQSSRVLLTAGAAWEVDHPPQVSWWLGDVGILVEPGFLPGHPELQLSERHPGVALVGTQGSVLRFPEGQVTRGRVDGRKALLAGERQSPSGRQTRTVLIQGSRIQVKDRIEGLGGESVWLRWILGPDWTEWEGEGEKWQARWGERQLIIKLAADLEWEVGTQSIAWDGALVEARVFLGRVQAPANAVYLSSFEIR